MGIPSEESMKFKDVFVLPYVPTQKTHIPKRPNMMPVQDWGEGPLVEISMRKGFEVLIAIIVNVIAWF